MCSRVHKMAILAKEKYPEGFEELDQDTESGCICEFKYTVTTGATDENLTQIDVYVSDIVHGINWYIPFGTEKLEPALLVEAMRLFNENKFLKFGPHPTGVGTILEGAVPNRDNDDDLSITETFNFMNAEVLISIYELITTFENLDGFDSDEPA